MYLLLSTRLHAHDGYPAEPALRQCSGDNFAILICQVFVVYAFFLSILFL